MMMTICFPKVVEPPFVFLTLMAILTEYVDRTSVKISSNSKFGWQAQFECIKIIDEKTMEELRSIAKDHQYQLEERKNFLIFS